MFATPKDEVITHKDPAQQDKPIDLEFSSRTLESFLNLIGSSIRPRTRAGIHLEDELDFYFFCQMFECGRHILDARANVVKKITSDAASQLDRCDAALEAAVSREDLALAVQVLREIPQSSLR